MCSFCLDKFLETPKLPLMNDISPLTRHPDVLYGPHQPELLRDEILADLLEASARRTPDHPALIAGDRRLTYRELDEQASLAAARLIDAGIEPGDIVGLWMPRGIDLLVMQAAIAKAGAAWLPVDEDTPVERLLVCMDDAGSPALVSSERMRDRLGAVTSPSTRPRRCSRPRPAVTNRAGAAPCPAARRPTSSTRRARPASRKAS
jgi:acyl-CoA synthetase (AMP-forming)/AMP-acid ligase II